MQVGYSDLCKIVYRATLNSIGTEKEREERKLEIANTNGLGINY